MKELEVLEIVLHYTHPESTLIIVEELEKDDNGKGKYQVALLENPFFIFDTAWWFDFERIARVPLGNFYLPARIPRSASWRIAPAMFGGQSY